jgi:hypothetical protein
MDIATLQNWLPTAIAAGGVGYIWWDIRRARSEWRKALYRDDGTPIYVMRDDCRREQSDCQAGVCAKISGVQAKLDAMDARREEQRNIIIDQLMRVATRVEGLAARLDEYIRGH